MTAVDTYFLWVFYVRILSICHSLIDSSISGGLIPQHLFQGQKGNNLKRFGPRGTKDHWFNPWQVLFTVFKEIISRESDQAALRPIGFIRSNILPASRQ